MAGAQLEGPAAGEPGGAGGGQEIGLNLGPHAALAAACTVLQGTYSSRVLYSHGSGAGCRAQPCVGTWLRC